MDLACLRVVPMRHSHDCVLCCLSMLLGVSYEAALMAVAAIRPDAGTNGLYWTEAQKAARLLGFTLRRYRGKDWANITGILSCLPPTASLDCAHAVILLRGVVIDPKDGVVWDDLDAYLSANTYTLGSALIRAS